MPKLNTYPVESTIDNATEFVAMIPDGQDFSVNRVPKSVLTTYIQTLIPAGETTTILNKGSLSGAQTFTVSAQKYQKLTVTGGSSYTITGWPTTGTLGELTIELVNGGAHAITWPAGIRWLKADGSYVVDFSNNGTTLQSSGTNFVCFWTHDAGSTIWEKVL